MNSEKSQQEVCSEVGSAFAPCSPDSKVGIALQTLRAEPLNALRHPEENESCGWYIWGGEGLSESPQFFQPVHVLHLVEYCPAIVPYLGLAPGWRVLLAPSQREVWYDSSLLSV